VKPQIIEGVLQDLAPRISGETLVYSIAAGKTLSDIAKHLPAGTAIVRAMPNTPVLVQNGMTALIANEHVSEEQKKALNALVSGTGTVAWLDDESQMDAVTAVSGSGPAYLFWLAECLVKAGIAQGLSSELATTLAKATIDGAGSMLASFDTPPSQLRENVTSKGGTTAAALEVLMSDDGLAPLIDAAIEAAAKRSKELSG
jgi:pyrroline-5-carboxylate reductase